MKKNYNNRVLSNPTDIQLGLCNEVYDFSCVSFLTLCQLGELDFGNQGWEAEKFV